MKTQPRITRPAIVVLLAATLGVQPLAAITYISVEPIPNRDVVGQDALDTLLSAGYPNLERWSNRLLNDCGIVQNVIDVLTVNGAISTVNSGNTSVRVAAGGFEAVTNPSFVATVGDSGDDGVSEEDVNVLDNALGYVLNQGGTAHFSPDNAKAYSFSLDYAVVTFAGTLTGMDAKAFFDYLGTIDFALWGGRFAGFTQIDFEGSPTNNSMLFLKPAASKRRLIDGLSTAASTTPAPRMSRSTTTVNRRRPRLASPFRVMTGLPSLVATSTSPISITLLRSCWRRWRRCGSSIFRQWRIFWRRWTATRSISTSTINSGALLRDALAASAHVRDRRRQNPTKPGVWLPPLGGRRPTGHDRLNSSRGPENPFLAAVVFRPWPRTFRRVRDVRRPSRSASPASTIPRSHSAIREPCCSRNGCA